MKGFNYLPGVATLRFDDKRCVGCGICTQVCPHAVFALETGKARLAEPDACMECGACAKNCPAGALSVRAGVGCAAGILNGMLRGTEPTCDCSGGSACCGG